MFVTFEQTGKDGEDAKQRVAVTKSFLKQTRATLRATSA